MVKRCLYVLVIIAALGLAGCQAPKSLHTAAKDIGFLGPDVVHKLKKGGPGQAAWVYMNPKTDWASYKKLELDPVTFWLKNDSATPALSRPDRQMLANYFYNVIHKALSRYMTMVSQPGAHTLRAQVAVTKAEPSQAVLDVISSVMPQAVVASTIKDALTGKPAFVGDAAIACMVRDSQTNELLAAWVAERVGGKQLDQAQFSSWGDVQQAMDFWAERAANSLCKLQKRGDCKPVPQE